MSELLRHWIATKNWLDTPLGVSRPILFSLPTLYFTWEAIRDVAGGGWGILALVLLWIAAVQEWVRWSRGRTGS